MPLYRNGKSLWRQGMDAAGDIDVALSAKLDRDAADAVVRDYLSGFEIDGQWLRPTLVVCKYNFAIAGTSSRPSAIKYVAANRCLLISTKIVEVVTTGSSNILSVQFGWATMENPAS